MLIFHGILTLFLAPVIYYDLTRYIIPDWIVGMLLALYPVFLLVAGFPEGFSAWYSLLSMAVVFGLGAIILALNWTGGGDVKLMTVLALWTGIEAVFPFLLYASILGGALSSALLLLRPAAGKLFHTRKPEALPRILRPGEPVPYGLAIVGGFLLVLWLGQIPGLPVPVELLGGLL